MSYAFFYDVPGDEQMYRQVKEGIGDEQPKDIEVIRLIVPAGKEIPTHKAKGEIVVQCLEGKVAYSAFGKTHHLETGQLLYLPTGEPHSVRGVEHGSLLLTILLPNQ